MIYGNKLKFCFREENFRIFTYPLYLIFARSKTNDKWIVYNKTEIVKECTIVLKQLTTNEEYCFRVSAVNEIGQSSYSELSNYVKVHIKILNLLITKSYMLGLMK